MAITDHINLDGGNLTQTKTFLRAHEAILVELGDRFAEFHKTRPPRSKIPVALRQAVLDAVARGVPLAALRRACRISPTQLKYWQPDRDCTNAPDSFCDERARVFSVGNTVPRHNNPIPNPPQAEKEIEVRIGEWSICIRQVDNKEPDPSTCCR